MPVLRRALLLTSVAALVFGVAMASATPNDLGSESPTTRAVAAHASPSSTPTTTAAASSEDDPRQRLLIDAAADPTSVPVPLPSGTQGTLIHAQRVIPTPSGIGAAYRVLYLSESLDARAIAVSGAVYLPVGTPPDAGWPVISWGRGTSGTADHCAPSRWIGSDTVPLDLARAGFLVTATDYEGLGTPGLHPYLVGDSEGRSMLDIVTAANAVPGVRATNSFSLWGHSQGAHAALFARELAGSWLPQRRLVATIAMAPPSFMPQLIDMWSTVRAKALGLMALGGISAAYPDAKLESLIRPEYLQAVNAGLEGGCTEEINRQFANIDGEALFTARPGETMPWMALLHAQEPAQRVGSGPVVLVHGELDATLPPAMSEAIRTQMCQRQEPVQRWLMAGMGHGEIIGGAWQAMSDWTAGRFSDGTPFTADCALTP